MKTYIVYCGIKKSTDPSRDNGAYNRPSEEGDFYEAPHAVSIEQAENAAAAVSLVLERQPEGGRSAGRFFAVEATSVIAKVVVE